MAGQLSLDDLVWDSASCVAGVVWGVHRYAFMKLEPPEQEIKVDKPRTLGQMQSTRRTPGVSELKSFKGVMLLTDWRALRAKMGKHGGTLIQAPITATIAHPAASGKHVLLMDDSRIIGRKPPPLVGDEKGLETELTIDCMAFWEQGVDGIFKCLNIDARQPSSAAPALGKF